MRWKDVATALTDGCVHAHALPISDLEVGLNHVCTVGRKRHLPASCLELGIEPSKHRYQLAA